MTDEIVFVGGTGRSGTHVLARLLGNHSRLADVPIEARFHCNRRGLADLLAGRATLTQFCEKLRGFWWHRVRVDGQPRGLYNLLGRRELDAAVERFEAAYDSDPLPACRWLFWELLGPVARRAGKPGLVEMSSHNLREAGTLQRLFPEARFVHGLRDGRDAASSVTTKTWGPRRVTRAIDWWADRLRAIDDGIRDPEGEPAIAPDRVHVVVLDELVRGDRERAYAGLLEFLGIDDEPTIRDFLERRISPEAAHAGRWAEGLGAVSRRRVRRRYERTLHALEREGNHAAPHLIAAYRRAERATEPA